jgi:hypothetical protein
MQPFDHRPASRQRGRNATFIGLWRRHSSHLRRAWPAIAALVKKHFGQYTGDARYTILGLDDIGRRIYFARMADELDPEGNRLTILTGIIRRAKTADA